MVRDFLKEVLSRAKDLLKAMLSIVNDLHPEMLHMDKDLHQETMEIDPIMEDLDKRQTQGIRTKEGAALIQSKAPNRVAMTNGRVAIANGQEKTFRSI